MSADIGTRSEDKGEGSPDDSMRCIQCNAPVPGFVCGRKQPCPSCGFPYPVGDCSDLAEN